VVQFRGTPQGKPQERGPSPEQIDRIADAVDGGPSRKKRDVLQRVGFITRKRHEFHKGIGPNRCQSESVRRASCRIVTEEAWCLALSNAARRRAFADEMPRKVSASSQGIWHD